MKRRNFFGTLVGGVLGAVGVVKAKPEIEEKVWKTTTCIDMVGVVPRNVTASQTMVTITFPDGTELSYPIEEIETSWDRREEQDEEA